MRRMQGALRNVGKVVAETGIDAEIVKEEDITKILEYGVYSLPALVVDDRVVSSGRRLTAAEVKKLLEA